MKLPESKINFKSYYRIEGDKIILGKKKYSCDQLMTLSLILRFLSLFAVIFGVMSWMQLGNYTGIILSVFGTLTLIWGYVYRKIVLEAAEECGRKITGIRRILYKL